MSEQIRLGVIAAGGKGERMYPVTKAVPKELFPLGRIPVVGHIAREFLEAGITEIIVVAGTAGGCTGRRGQEVLF